MYLCVMYMYVCVMYMYLCVMYMYVCVMYMYLCVMCVLCTCICVLWVSILPQSTIFLFDFGTVPTVMYFCFVFHLIDKLMLTKGKA
jgi:hypothetical protein